MGMHNPFEYLRHKLWSKEGWESKCQFDSWPLKVKNLLELRVWRMHVTYNWKTIDEGYNFSLNLISIGGLHKKLWASKVAGIPILGILRLLTWESRGKLYLGATFVTKHIE